jgi:predicted transcriptional regulator
MIRLRDVLDLLDGELLGDYGNLELPFETACGADLMSDVLAFVHSGSLLLSGLTHPQVVRSAEMVDAAAIVFVRGKTPLPETIALAKEKRLPIILTRYTLFESCGRLYAAGLEACDVRGDERRGFEQRLRDHVSTRGVSETIHQ